MILNSVLCLSHKLLLHKICNHKRRGGGDFAIAVIFTNCYVQKMKRVWGFFSLLKLGGTRITFFY